MDIKTFRAASMQEALRLVRHELGPEAAVLRTREVRTGGMLGLLTGERGIEVEASAEVIVPSRLPKRPVVLDHGIDLTEMAQLRLSPVGSDRPSAPSSKHSRTAPQHVVVVGAAAGVGSTTVAVNLLAALGQQQLNAVLWNVADDAALSGFGRSSHRAAATDVLLVDVGAEPTQKFDRLYAIASLVLLVITPDSKSILDGYAAIKQLRQRHPTVRIQTVVNQATDQHEAHRVHQQLAQTCQRFLGLEIAAAGYVASDAQIAAATHRRRSIVDDRPHGAAAAQFKQIASQIGSEAPIKYLRFETRKNLKIPESTDSNSRY